MKIEYMDGTESEKSYLIVAKRKGTLLGIKPILAKHPIRNRSGHVVGWGLYTGARFRAVPEPGRTATRGALLDAWPKIEFTRIDAVRAACDAGGWSQVNSENHQECVKVLETNNIVADIASVVYARLEPGSAIVSKTEFEVWLDERFMEILDTLTGVAKPVEAKSSIVFDAAEALKKIIEKHGKKAE